MPYTENIYHQTKLTIFTKNHIIIVKHKWVFECIYLTQFPTFPHPPPPPGKELCNFSTVLTLHHRLK